MVLTNKLFLGLVLLVSLACTSSTTTTTTNPSTITTIIPPNVTSPTNEESAKTTQSHIPKTELNQQIFTPDATSTEIPDEKRKVEDDIIRQDNGRSLDINSEKYNIPDFHSENNVFSESKNYEKEMSSKTMEYERMFDNIQLTTPENNFFDSRHKQVQDEISRTMGEREKIFTMKLEHENKYFYSKAPDFSERPENEYKIDEFKKIESTESKNKNKIHRDHTIETNKKMEMNKIYNETKIIDEPKKDDDKKDVSQNEVKDEISNKKERKPMDLDQESSDQIAGIHIEKLKHPIINNNTIDVATNSSLNKEQLDPIMPNAAGIVVTKRGPKMKYKTTTMVNLEESNVVEVTTKGKNINDVSQISADGDLKGKHIKGKIDSYDMKMINVINDNETETSEQPTTVKKPEIIPEETTTIENETTTSDEQESTIDNTRTTESMITTTEEVIIKNISVAETTTMKSTSPLTDETTQTETKTTEAEAVETTTLGGFDESGSDFSGLLEQFLSNSTAVPPDTTTVTTTMKFYAVDDDDGDDLTVVFEVTTEKSHKTNEIKKKNETVSDIANQIFKSPPSTSPSTESNEVKTIPPMQHTTDAKIFNATRFNENEIIKQNEINVLGDRSPKASTTEEPSEKDCYLEQCEDAEDEYADPNGSKKKDLSHDLDEMEDASEKVVVNYDAKVTLKPSTTTTEVDSNNIEPRTLNASTARFKPSEVDVEITTTPAGLVDGEGDDDEEGNGGKIAAIVISTVGAVCLFLLVGLLIVMRKRQKRFNYGQRCRPVSLDAYSMDNVSIHNSTRRKGVLMTSKRSYGNAAFEDPNSPSHPLNFSELVKFANNTEEIQNEFEQIPQVQAKTSELPDGCEVKNRYANVIPLPETRVYLSGTDGDPTSDYINANFVTGAKSERRYYIACQAPLQNTIGDFWRMIWEQESKVILMLTHLYEHGIEKCIDYLPPSEVLDCHRLFGDFQVTLKKREVRDKYIISSLQLKNMVSNSWREVTHIWYIEWPHKGVPDEANSLIRFLIEARSYMKVNEIKVKEANTSFIQGTTPRNPPVVVHCSPGTGRTGTVIACDIAIREFEQSRQVDIPKIVYKIRRDRASAVQTNEQYSFIYNVINLYATKLTGGAFDTF